MCNLYFGRPWIQPTISQNALLEWVELLYLHTCTVNINRQLDILLQRYTEQFTSINRKGIDLLIEWTENFLFLMVIVLFFSPKNKTLAKPFFLISPKVHRRTIWCWTPSCGVNLRKTYSFTVVIVFHATQIFYFSIWQFYKTFCVFGINLLLSNQKRKK